MRKKTIYDTEKRKERLLILDDDESLAELLKLMLEKYFEDVNFLTSPRQAVEEVIKNSYDVLISDFIMEYMNGEEVVKEIRKVKNKEVIKIIIMSGFPGFFNPGKIQGIQGYIEKTDRVSETISRIIKIIEGEF